MTNLATTNPATSISGSLPPLRKDVAAPRPPRRSRIPQLLTATLLIVVGSAAAFLLFQNYNTRSTVVVVTGEVGQGQRLDRDDLAITDAALGSGIGTPLQSLDDAVGLVASHDLEPGDLIGAADLTTEELTIGPDQIVIGVVVEPGGYPTKDLAGNDFVDVFTPSQQDGEITLAPLAEDLVVRSVTEVSRDGETLLVSLIVSPEEAAAIINAEAEEGIRLGLHGGNG